MRALPTLSAVLLACALAAAAPAGAKDPKLNADFWSDTGAPAPAPAFEPWAQKVVVDTQSATVMLVWFDGVPAGQPPRTREIPFSSVTGLLRVPTYEGLSEELALVLQGGEKALISLGPEAKKDASMLAAVIGKPLSVAPAGAERLVPADAAASSPGPRIVLGSIRGVDALTPVGQATSSADAGLPMATSLRTFEQPPGWLAPGEGAGELDRDDIDVVVRAKMGVFKSCYQRELQRNPDLAGKVTIQFVIGLDGVVTKARVQATSLHNDQVEQCLAQSFVGTPFPQPRGGTVLVSYPFNFTGT